MRFIERFEVAENRDLPWAADFLLPAVMWVLLGLPFPAYDTGPEIMPAGALIASTALILPLALRRHYPLIMLGLMTLGGLYTVAAVPFPLPAIAAVPIAIYHVARWVQGPRARISVVVGTAASIIGPARWTLLSGTSSAALSIAFALMVAICIGLVLSPYMVGRRVQETARTRKAQQDFAVERYQRAVQSREQAARIAETKARTEIARELHDIVAHSLSVMIVQAEGGKALASKYPERAEEVLGTIAETGREALGEMRRIVGVLRSDAPPAAEYTPTPGLSDLPEMLAKAGDRISYVPPAWLPEVPTTLGLTVYRIVQESVTNVLKHAGADARATVKLQATPRFLRVEITDDGDGSSASSDGAGSGLKGMRERVMTMGGTLVAGRRPEGGYSVVALLPLPPRRPQPRARVVPEGVRT